MRLWRKHKEESWKSLRGNADPKENDWVNRMQSPVDLLACLHLPLSHATGKWNTVHHTKHTDVFVYFPQEPNLFSQTLSTVKTGNRNLAAVERSRLLNELPHCCSKAHLTVDLKPRADSSETCRNRTVFYSTVNVVSKICLVFMPWMLKLWEQSICLQILEQFYWTTVLLCRGKLKEVGVGRREQATQKRTFPFFVFSAFPRDHNSYLTAASSTQSLVLPCVAHRNVCIGAW